MGQARIGGVPVRLTYGPHPAQFCELNLPEPQPARWPARPRLAPVFRHFSLAAPD